jgi:hypothetical protein
MPSGLHFHHVRRREMDHLRRTGCSSCATFSKIFTKQSKEAPLFLFHEQSCTYKHAEFSLSSHSVPLMPASFGRCQLSFASRLKWRNSSCGRPVFGVYSRDIKLEHSATKTATKGEKKKKNEQRNVIVNKAARAE